jgi:hypothetical protein
VTEATGPHTWAEVSVSQPAARQTPAQVSFWRRLRRVIPGAPETFTPGKYPCPGCAKNATDRSLAVGYNDVDKEVWFHCFRGCVRNELRGKFGMNSWTELRDYGAAKAGTPDGEYTYTDETGVPLFRVCRTRNPASARTQIRDEGGEWTWAPRGWKRPYVLYRAPDIAQAIELGEVVYLAASEADADAIVAHGGVATAIPDPPGKGGFRVEYCEALRGAYLRVVAVRHEAGRDRARLVAAALSLHVADVQVLEPGVVKDGATARDHLDRASGRLLDDLSPLSLSETRATVQPLPAVPADPPPLASDQRILDAFKAKIRKLGVVGEERVAATAYLTLTSRLLDKQASLAVKGHSASGKSFTVEQTGRFFPAEATIVMTAMSDRALVYSTEEYAHRTLVLYEATALREGVEDSMVAYFVRSLLSEGRIEYPVTVKDAEGNFTTRTIVKEGPTNLIVTTTKVQVHAENETRVLSVTTDDSRGQTKRVFAALADETDPGVDLAEWVTLQRWLAGAEHRVTIPYAATLAELIPPVAVRLRRDFGTLLALIRAHAVLHQQTRKRDEAGRIIATADDYEQVRELVEDVMAEGVAATVRPVIREVVEVVQALTEDNQGAQAKYPDGAMVKVVADKLELDKSATSRRLATAAAAGYVVNAEEKRGRPGRWKLGEPLPGCTGLLPGVHQLCDVHPAGQHPDDGSGCTVARQSERERDEAVAS